jgi:hypothetical protein
LGYENRISAFSLEIRNAKKLDGAWLGKIRPRLSPPPSNLGPFRLVLCNIYLTCCVWSTATPSCAIEPHSSDVTVLEKCISHSCDFSPSFLPTDRGGRDLGGSLHFHDWLTRISGAPQHRKTRSFYTKRDLPHFQDPTLDFFGAW